ncbi:hypothetical protein B0O99DRAFT_507606 [Bisporella sp. PMI_857]|nr:hypothetical protein B0O99DRAFT_507606 [Bisporella sp. PMI_857]
MQISNILSVAAFFAFVHSLPTEKRTVAVDVTFYGAADAKYTLSVPLDGSAVLTNNVLSISRVSSSINVAKQCTLKTVDYPPALVEGPPGSWQVGPPQTVTSIACTSANGQSLPVPTVSIQFNGAADAKYSLTVPLNGDLIPTNNVLSISTIVTTYVDLPYCNIQYVDGKAALVKIAPDTWAVGPPQTIKSIQCWQYHTL